MFALFSSRLRGLAICCVAMALAVSLAWWDPPVVKRLDMAVFDNFQALVTPPPLDRKVVAVLASEASMIAIRQWPWPRSIHAALLQRLRLANTVAFDIIMSERSDAAEDRRFLEAIAKSGNVVQAMHLVLDEDDNYQLMLPFPELAVTAAGVGITNIPAEPDGIYRDAFLYWRHSGQLVDSFPTAIWMNAGNEPPQIERRGDQFFAELPSGELRMNENLAYKIHHPAEEIPTFEYADVLKGVYPEETFRDAVVLVGVNAAGATDYFPIGRSRVLAGVLYNAHAVLTLMHGWIPFDAPRWMMIAAAGVLAVLGVAIGLGRSVRRSWLWTLAVLLVWVGVSSASFFGMMRWLPPVLPSVCLVVSFFSALAIQLRFVSGEWNVSHMSIESLLFLGGESRETNTTFPEYLASRWASIEKWSGISLIDPYAGQNHAEVARVLAGDAGNGNIAPNSAISNVATIATSRQGSRMLLQLPETRTGEMRYAILGWKGTKSAETLKSVTVLVLSSAMHFKALEESQARRELFLSVIRLIMGAVDAKDPTTAGHSERVADLSRELAEIIGLPPKEIEEIYLAGLLHDVGKIGVPDSILNFPGRLSDEDMAVMRKHPDIGAGIMDKIELSATVRYGIVEHHERMDGKGYPNGATRDHLSLAGRILKIADVYDALVSKRQYKDPMPGDLVYKILVEGSGKEFDPDLLNVFLSRHFPGNFIPAEPAAQN